MFHDLHPIQIGLVVVAVSMATLIDVVSHRIPNWLTVSTILAGLSLGSWIDGWSGFAAGVVGLLVAFVFFLPFYLFRWMGAGDVKLLMAVCACLGWRTGILSGLCTLILGAMAAFIFMAIKGDLLSYMGRYWVMAKSLLYTGQFAYIPPQSGQSAAARFPYALAIALGTLAAIFGPQYWPLMKIPLLSAL